MKTTAFIFNWQGQTQATELEERLSRLCQTIVVNSDESAERDGWVNVGDEAWFASQWNAALVLFQQTDSDVLWHVQADARDADFERLHARAGKFLTVHNWGLYAPHILSSPHQAKGKQYSPTVYEADNTDCVVWMVHRDILSLSPMKWFPGKYGWGIDWLYAQVAKAVGCPVMRDYAVKVQHAAGVANYNARQARGEFEYIRGTTKHALEELRKR